VIYLEAVHMRGGERHEHIADVAWRNPDTGARGQSPQSEMVRWISSGGEAYVLDSAGHLVRVGVVQAAPPYIRTHADGVYTDNLLALPRY
jgi:hypothetical protein